MLQHFKDVLNMRKNEGEILRKLRQQNHNSSAQAGADVRGPETQGSSDVTLLMSREQCVPVIRGLVALMLSMDFTCNVDFFVVISKVCYEITLQLVYDLILKTCLYVSSCRWLRA